MPDTYLAKARGLFSAPREPVLQEAGLMDDLVAKACILCSRPSRRNNTQPGYGMKRGEKVLLGVDSSYDWRVVEAMKAAAGELGAKMDIIMVDSGGPQRSVYHITETPLDGADEARSVQRSIGTDIRRNPYLVREIADKHNYDLVINGTAGPIPDTAYRWERLPWTTVEHWAGEEIAFPIELQVAIDSVVWEQIQRCVRVRFTDPEGTDVTFSNYNDSRWMYQSHQWGKPLYITAEEDATGVIAGTTNHRGVFQWCEPYLYRVAEWFAAGRGLVLVMALLVTVASVLSNGLFGKPVLGDTEIVELLMGVAVAAFMPWCQVRGANVFVDFFTMKFPQRVNAGIDAVAYIVFAVIVGVLTWPMVDGTLTQYERERASMFLKIPQWWGYALASCASVVWVLVCEQWDWRQANGQYKAFAARDLPVRLERAGLVELPAPQRVKVNRPRHSYAQIPLFIQTPLGGRLAEHPAPRLQEAHGAAEHYLWDYL